LHNFYIFTASQNHLELSSVCRTTHWEYYVISVLAARSSNFAIVDLFVAFEGRKAGSGRYRYLLLSAALIQWFLGWCGCWRSWQRCCRSAAETHIRSASGFQQLLRGRVA